MRVNEDYKKDFKCPVEGCGKWKRVEALREIDGEKMCTVCFNRKIRNNKDK